MTDEQSDNRGNKNQNLKVTTFRDSWLIDISATTHKICGTEEEVRMKSFLQWKIIQIIILTILIGCAGPRVLIKESLEELEAAVEKILTISLHIIISV